MQKTYTFTTQYLALANFLNWLSDIHNLKADGTVRNEILTLDDTISQRFAIGFPRKTVDNKKPTPFIAVSKREAVWFNNLKWKHAYFREGDRRLYFVSSAIQRDDDRYPDIPSITIAVTTNDIEKLRLLFKEKPQVRIEGRNMWIDEENEIRVDLTDVEFSIPLSKLDSDSLIPSDEIDPEAEPDLSLQKEALGLQQLQDQTPNQDQPRRSRPLQVKPGGL